MQGMLIQQERALAESRAASLATATARATSSLVDTRSIGKAPNFSGEHKDWHDWSFQFVAYMGSANPKCIEALKAAAQREMAISNAEVDAMGEEYKQLSTSRTSGWRCYARAARLRRSRTSQATTGWTPGER